MQNNKKSASRRYTILYGVAAILMIAVVITSQFIVNDLTKPKAKSNFVLNHEREFPGNVIKKNPRQELPNPIIVPEQKNDLKTVLPIVNHDPVAKVSDREVAQAVSPPMKEFDIRYITTKVDVSMGQVIKTKTQSKIMIPPDAFVDKNGKPVSGNVDVKFREFHNYQDILLSGIPMKYNSANGQQQLESAGMIEVLASKDNEQLYMSPSKQVKIMLASFTKDADYNLYYFDKEKREWIEKGKDEVSFIPDPFERDTTQWEYTEADRPYYVYDLKKYSLRFFSESDMTPKRKFLIGKRESPKSFEFKIITSSKGFPELKNFSQQKWIYTGVNASDVYYNLIQRKTKDKKVVRPEWQKLTLTPVEGKNSYTLLLQNQNELFQIEVEPVLKSKVQRKNFEKQYEKFTTDHDRRLKNDDQAYVKWQVDTAYQASQFTKTYTRKVSTSNLIMRNFTINNFGIWNCDRPMEIPSAMTVQASFTNQYGKSLNPEIVYLVDKNVNTVFTINRRISKEVKFNPNSVNMLYTILSDGKIAILKPIQLDKNAIRKNERQCNFVMQVYDQPRSPSEVKKLISL